jgi:hypothetical protein
VDDHSWACHSTPWPSLCTFIFKYLEQLIDLQLRTEGYP